MERRKVFSEYSKWVEKNKEILSEAGARFGCVHFHVEYSEGSVRVRVAVAEDKSIGFDRECDTFDPLADRFELRDTLEDFAGVCILDDGQEWEELIKCEDPWKVYDHYREYGCVDTIKETRIELEGK